MAELLSSVKNSKWRLSSTLYYCVAMLDHSRSLIGDRKIVFKFPVDRVCSFEDIFNRKFCQFGLKRLSWPPKFTFLGILTLNIIFHHRAPIGTSLAENTSYQPSCVVVDQAVWPGRGAKTSLHK